MKQRIITAIFLIIGLLLVLFVLPKFLFPYAMFVVLMIAVWEWNKITQLEQGSKIRNYIIATCLYLLAIWVPLVLKSLVVITLFYYFFAILQIFNYEKKENYKINKTLLEAPGAIILATLSATIVSVNLISTSLFIYIILVISCADSGAYFVGRFLGKNKLAKRVSPKKTIEGLIGGLVISMIVALAFKFLVASTSLTFLAITFIALATSLFSVIGDLFISVIKRQNDIKDSSQILPGHGGILDRIDGLISGIPVFYFFAFIVFG